MKRHIIKKHISTHHITNIRECGVETHTSSVDCMSTVVETQNKHYEKKKEETQLNHDF